MSPPVFASLPPEIVLRIICQLDTPRDVAAYIKTSRYTYQVFQHSRNAVLVAVIRNAMPDDNVYIAAAACSAAQISKLWWTGSSAAAVADAQDEFFKTNPYGRVSEDCSLRDPKLLHSLYRLWWISDYFITRFTQDALATAALKMPSIPKQPELTISCRERSRLQRACLRFEIYRRITPSHIQHQQRVPREAEMRTWSILKQFPPWEREEILCIQEFLVDFAKDMVKRCGDFLIQEVSTVAREMATKAEAPLEGYGPEPEDPMKRLSKELDLSGLDVFDYNSLSCPRRFQYLVGRGLPFLRWLSRLTPKQRIYVLKHHIFEQCEPTFWEVLVVRVDQLTIHDIKVKWLDMKSTGDLQSPNPGWTWAVGHDSTAGERSLCRRYTLRKMGYVFWDEARLYKEWRLQDTSPKMLNLAPRGHEDIELDWHKSVEQEFKDVEIPENEGAYDESRDDSIYGRLRVDSGWKRLHGGRDYARPFSKREDESFGIEY